MARGIGPALKTFYQLSDASHKTVAPPPMKAGRLIVLRQDNTPFPLVDVQTIFQWTDTQGQPAFSAPHLVGNELPASVDTQIPGPDIDLDYVYFFYREGRATDAPRRVLYILPHRDWKPSSHWHEIVVDFLYIGTPKGTYYGIEHFVR